MGTEGCKFGFFCALICDFRYVGFFRKVTVLSSFHIEPVTLPPRMEHVSECPSRASLSGFLQPHRPIPALVLRLSAQTTTLQNSHSVCIGILGYQYTIRYAVNMQVFFFRLMVLSFNLFLYIEELNCCFWEVWTLGETTVCHCWKEAMKQMLPIRL